MLSTLFLLQELDSMPHLLEDIDQVPRFDSLVQNVARPGLAQLYRLGCVCKSGQDNHRGAGETRRNLPGGVESQTIPHHRIDEYDIWLERDRVLDRLGAAVGLAYDEETGLVAEPCSNAGSHVRVIVRQQNTNGFHQQS